MLLYLDLNCFNRPFDDQTQERIARETAAVFAVLERVERGIDQLAWSAVLALENSRHPLLDRRRESLAGDVMPVKTLRLIAAFRHGHGT